MVDATLRFSPRVLVHLGEALVPNADQAILELVKNAFDADATECTVRLDRDDDGMVLEISDDGLGMSSSDVRNKWLLIGSSTKRRDKRTRRFNRVQVGDKGLGRLAALRLGSVAEIDTKPIKGPACSVTLDWNKINAAPAVEDVVLPIVRGRRRKSGTSVTVRGIAPLSEREVQRIGRALTLVNDPFRSRTGFSVAFRGTAVKKPVHFTRQLFSQSQYHIRASQTDGGRLIFALKGPGINISEEVEPFDTVPFTFDLWEYRLTSDDLSARGYPLSEIRSWLSVFGGVHLFAGPIRIAPYGDRPVDWLDINLLRARSPENRPSTNNSIGRVVIDNSSDQILQTTDRVSFVENDAYANLRSACTAALNWAANQRNLARDSKRQEARAQLAADPVKIKSDTLRLLRERLPTVEYREVSGFVAAAFDASIEQINTLRADAVLYRAMATAGITSVVFAHEIGQPLGLLRRRLPALAAQVEEAGLRGADLIKLVQQAAERLSRYVDLPVRLAAKARRRTGNIDLGEAVEDSLNAYGPIIGERQIAIDSVIEKGIIMQASRAMIDAIIGNFITNSVRAFDRGMSDAKRPRLRVRLLKQGGRARLTFGDNAGGLDGIKVSEIWAPGSTTTPGGTGFGLTIVRDTIADLNGEVLASESQRPRGIEFIASFPLVG